MSQYGAYGFAQNGSGYRDILAHYYTDTAIGSLDPARRVREYPHQLSGGMRQRVALARTMVIDPKILLLDEPFAAVDFQTKLLLQQDLLAILEQTRMSVLYITHDIGEALSLCTRVIVMSHRPGRVKSEHAVTIPHALGVFEKRNHPRFNVLFQDIWKDLEFDIRIGVGLPR